MRLLQLGNLSIPPLRLELHPRAPMLSFVRWINSEIQLRRYLEFLGLRFRRQKEARRQPAKIPRQSPFRFRVLALIS